MNNGIVNRLFLAALLFVCTDLCGQNVQIKTNLLYDATATINIGSECRLGRRWSLDLSGSYNGWKLGGDRKWKHWLVQPEGRYWFGSAFKGHYVGVHLHGGQMNLGHVGFGGSCAQGALQAGVVLRVRCRLRIPVVSKPQLAHGGRSWARIHPF